MSTQETDNGEPDDFARTDLRTGQPAPARSRQTIDRALLDRLRAQVTLPRAVVTTIVALILAALVATQLGYTQRLIDSVRYRIQMAGVPELTEMTIAPQPATYLTTANWAKIALPAPASQINDFSADPTDPQSLLVCGLSSLDTPTIHGEMTPRGPVAVWLTHNAGKTWIQSQAPVISGMYCWISRAPETLSGSLSQSNVRRQSIHVALNTMCCSATTTAAPGAQRRRPSQLPGMRFSFAHITLSSLVGDCFSTRIGVQPRQSQISILRSCTVMTADVTGPRSRW